MKINIFQKGFNYSQDGTGNRLIYHLQGCNMHCPWCANPEGMLIKGTLMVNNELLMDSICPFGAIGNKQVDRSRCELCPTRECVVLHRNQGIRLSFEETGTDLIIEEIQRSSVLFYDGGGVTFTGGEPTLQFNGLKTLLEEIKLLNIHTAVETNGSHPKLAELFPFIDLLIMDFKHYDNEMCARLTGVGNLVIKENIARALAVHKNVVIRIPVIKGFNDTETDIRSFAAFFRQHPTGNAAFEFLPYHEYGRAKWLQCGMPYTMKDAFVGAETIVLYETIFKENNLSIVHS